MKKIGKIKKVGAERTYTTHYGEVVSTPVVFEWQEQGSNGSYEQAVCLEVKGKVNREVTDKVILTGEEIEVNFYLGCMESTKTPGSFFNRITGNLPAKFLTLTN